MGLVVGELLLALWLLIGLCPWLCRRLAFVIFLSYACVAFYQGVAGRASCGCFGRVQVNPWWTFALDGWILAALYMWRPRTEQSVANPQPRGSLPSMVPRVASSVVLCLVLSAALVVAGRNSVRIGSGADDSLVILEPDKWLGQEFPLFEFIDIGESLHDGEWIVVLYRHGCSDCQNAILRCEEFAKWNRDTGSDLSIALIEVPLFQSTAGSEQSRFCQLGHLSEAKEWFVTTPAAVRLRDGQVIATGCEQLLAKFE